ncbi:RNA 2',3'-cyclic phosphodiesterase [Salimicrobium flavidum]|uniref:RNA 2',3'-cyclic phosphodiesterase n=1 Tax=Salimicrobium flavidum TaxID=570947 RepID=A0A1N7JTF8_9BACI|nr:RNA 2',3'-cyclic phosphodiesterase [Salimicrobium flavidum]SIS52551.1 2'-5' RNA ligase [Salimicrobium flavidum]
MKSTHYFIGLPVRDGQLIEKLVERQQRLQEHMDYKVWPAPEDFHVTLRFLGEVEDFTYWKQKVEEASTFSSFRLPVGGVDFFGNGRTPRVVYQSIPLTPELRHLYDHFQDGAQKSFRPHITLAKKWRDGVLPSLDPEESYPWEVNSCALFRIRPGESPKYEQVASAVLRR